MSDSTELMMRIFGIILFCYTIKNRKNLSPSFFGIKETKYEVINKEKLNEVLKKQGYTLSIGLIIMGYSSTLKIPDIFIIVVSVGVIIASIVFKRLTKKYVIKK